MRRRGFTVEKAGRPRVLFRAVKDLDAVRRRRVDRREVGRGPYGPAVAGRSRANRHNPCSAMATAVSVKSQCSRRRSRGSWPTSREGGPAADDRAP
ncbi:uncharacterized protein A4U43_C07F34650 [Asparagus officinalis]|uniref:Uncharacterized protein n=1 Tax=Asparagus officinalis TaxID=4686 RepID=A0A5P1EHD1_ASPOF|nr:uncharacterized protein A4U43_C07F34650 [Asparagus officinalis]